MRLVSDKVLCLIVLHPSTSSQSSDDTKLFFIQLKSSSLTPTRPGARLVLFPGLRSIWSLFRAKFATRKTWLTGRLTMFSVDLRLIWRLFRADTRKKIVGTRKTFSWSSWNTKDAIFTPFHLTDVSMYLTNDLQATERTNLHALLKYSSNKTCRQLWNIGVLRNLSIASKYSLPLALISLKTRVKKP